MSRTFLRCHVTGIGLAAVVATAGCVARGAAGGVVTGGGTDGFVDSLLLQLAGLGLLLARGYVVELGLALQVTEAHAALPAYVDGLDVVLGVEAVGILHTLAGEGEVEVAEFAHLHLVALEQLLLDAVDQGRGHAHDDVARVGRAVTGDVAREFLQGQHLAGLGIGVDFLFALLVVGFGQTGSETVINHNFLTI